MPPAAASQPPTRRALRALALPTEHGGWGFLLQPLLLGLLIAFSWRGLLLALVALGFFLLRQPYKIYGKERLAGRRSARLLWSRRFLLAYGLLAALPLAILLLVAPPDFLLPLALALPLIGLQLFFESRRQPRHLLAELSGVLALAAFAPAITMLGGWSLGLESVLWLLLALQEVAAILYVRARLRVLKGRPARTLPALLAHLAAFLLVYALVIWGLAPWLALLAFVILGLRALWGLSGFAPARPARQVGFQELFYGLLTVLLLAFGY